MKIKDITDKLSEGIVEDYLKSIPDIQLKLAQKISNLKIFDEVTIHYARIERMDEIYMSGAMKEEYFHEDEKPFLDIFRRETMMFPDKNSFLFDTDVGKCHELIFYTGFPKEDKRSVGVFCYLKKKEDEK